MKLESEPVVVGAVGKVKIQPLLRDFQAEGESPALGLFHGAAFSTALLPTNSAKEPKNETIPSSSSGGICYVKIDCRGRYMELMGESKKIFDSLQ